MSEFSNKRGNVVFRQELKSLTPRCEPKCSMWFNLFMILLFLSFGIPIIVTGNSVIEYSKDYTNCETNKDGYCIVNININKTITSPIYVYYELRNFYMNHRDFAKSRSYPQLRGEVHVDKNNNSRCEGAKYVKEIFDNDESKYFSYSGKKLKGDDYANPCGLIAKSYFNDTFSLYDYKMSSIFIDETGIANDYDKTYMFKRHSDSQNLQWINVENDHFIVWMQMESFQNFRKLWGRINDTLSPGDYKFLIKNNYNVTSFNGEKLIILSTTSSLGTGLFFGYALVGGAIYCLALLIVLFIFYRKNINKEYDISCLKWE